MSSKNVVLVDKEKNQLAPATIAEQVEYSGSNVKRVLEHYIASPETMRKSSATLWSGSVYQKDDTMVLSQSPENFDEIIVQYDDEYRVFPAADFGASPAVLQKLSTRDTIYSDVSLNTEIELYYGELAISRVGASGSVNYKLSRSKAWSWSGESSEPSEIENGTLDITGAVTKIIGVKYANDAEVYDLRLGADGEEYDTAGEAVRTLIAKNADEKVPYPTSSGGTVIYGTAGQALLSKGDGTTEWGAGGGLSDEAKDAILEAFEHVAWIDDQGQDYVDAIRDAFYPPVHATSVTLNKSSLSFTAPNQSQTLVATVLPADATDTVTWSSSDTSVATVNNGVVTTVTYGTATITATAGSVSATCSVLVAQATLVSISAVYTQTGTVYDADSLDSLKSDLVVTATWSDSSTSTVAAADYTLSGTLAEGTSTITVSYGGKTDAFDVTVTTQPNGLVDGTYTNGSVVITVSNNVLSYGSTTSGYKNFSIPLVRQIELHAGDVVQFVGSNGNPTGNNSAPIGLNDETYLTNFSPYKSPSGSKSTTLSADMTLTHIRTQAQTAQANSSFTLSMIVNDEVIF